ncbi:MAG: hypothetical protein LQ347_001071 [Umbilicaria vellea]|nr:MAG: hypothetical protein LQ347_001071 [Umbilicaria vellea]
MVLTVHAQVSERPGSPSQLSFGWQRSQLLGAFFNGVFLLALGVSILLQAIERFISIQRLENPKLVLIIGCIGLALNIISVCVLHEHESRDFASNGIQLNRLIRASLAHQDHRHSNATTSAGKGRDLGVMGVLIHIMGDAVNNVGVIIAALVIWLTKSDSRFYADPGVSVGIALLILASAIPLESVPIGVNIDDVQHDLEMVYQPGTYPSGRDTAKYE